MKSLSESVSGDVLLDIASYLSPIDILHLSVTASSIYVQVIRALYDVVELKQMDQCYNTVNMLYKHPEIARRVRKLTLRPNPISPRFLTNKSPAAADMHLVMKVLKRAAFHLDALHTFIWAGEECLPDDEVWWVLQVSCPQLKCIGAGFGSVLPSIKSHLFDFHDLHEFTISFESGFYSYMHFETSPETEPIFKRLWDMLINRCPDLRSLSIITNDIDSLDSIDARRLCQSRWPKLRHLQLGNVTVPWASTSEDGTPFITFLNEHQSLESLHLTRRFKVPHGNLDEFASLSLPRLTEFTGTASHLQALPRTLLLKSISISEPLVVRDLTPMNISNILQAISSLVSLEISFTLQSGYDSVSVLRSIISTCPHLRHLDLTCCHKPSFSLEEFARALRSLPRLQTFNLTLVRAPGDESMCEGAARIARTNPRLYGFSITYIYQDNSINARTREKGEFELICDKHGLPVSLFTRQWRSKLWGGASYTSHNCDLRPLGHPELARRGLMELVLDKSQAGRDLRLLASSLLLVLVTFWAVV